MTESELILWKGLMIFTIKIISFIFGFFIVRLGYYLIRDGISGKFKFSADYKGIKGGLVSSSPGLLFLVLGAFIIVSGIVVNEPIKFGYDTEKNIKRKYDRDKNNSEGADTISIDEQKKETSENELNSKINNKKNETASDRISGESLVEEEVSSKSSISHDSRSNLTGPYLDAMRSLQEFIKREKQGFINDSFYIKYDSLENSNDSLFKHFFRATNKDSIIMY